MADNKVNFLRGTSAEYESKTKDNDTFYYTTDTKKLYLGETEITGIEIDDTSTTATGKTWSAKKISDSIPTTLPANGGNADTVDGLHANEIASNPNLLINPDFSINQRGKSEYTAGYTVDRWKVTTSGDTEGHGAVYNVQEKTLTCATYNTSGYYAILQQYIEDLQKFAGMQMTLSAYISEFNAPTMIRVWRAEGEMTTAIADMTCSESTINQLTFTMPSDLTVDSKVRVVLHTKGTAKFEWVKLEIGSIATPYTPPDPATELAKCQRYYYSTYQGVPAGTPASYANELVLNAISTNRFNHTMIDFPTTMRTTPTVKFFDPDTGEEGYACKSGTNEKVPVAIIIAGQDRVNFGSSGLTVGADYYLHYTASAEL